MKKSQTLGLSWFAIFGLGGSTCKLHFTNKEAEALRAFVTHQLPIQMSVDPNDLAPKPASFQGSASLLYGGWPRQSSAFRSLSSFREEESNDTDRENSTFTESLPKSTWEKNDHELARLNFPSVERGELEIMKFEYDQIKGTIPLHMCMHFIYFTFIFLKMQWLISDGKSHKCPHDFRKPW